MACHPDTTNLLKNLGVKIGENHITQDLFLIDETDKHYILGFERLPVQDGNDRTIKVNKEIVKAILFIPDHIVLRRRICAYRANVEQPLVAASGAAAL